ncbi:MAG: hypothetical protein KA250_12905 [Verrucomicrobiales bacterium]|jgi:hypothetical protein|nr:hypothetical protein [Verrucomicrobiales bacterium]MBP9223964.1 hypothetical protein [Verrucomicrobiales bacterium]HQZ29786.1 hypothetical protein [Verrucomicrobiales bacterium]
MKNLTFLCSAILIVLGLYGYYGWESIGAAKQSPTALIPTIVGVLMLLGGIIALKNHKVGMHIAVLFSLLGALAGLGRLIPGLIKGTANFSQASTQLILGMTIVCAFFTVMAVRSFIAARRARG